MNRTWLFCFPMNRSVIMVKVYVEKGAEVYVTTKLSSVLSKVNMVYNCDITFAFNNVGFIMEKKSEYYSVFNYCYQNIVTKRVYTI